MKEVHVRHRREGTREAAYRHARLDRGHAEGAPVVGDDALEPGQVAREEAEHRALTAEVREEVLPQPEPLLLERPQAHEEDVRARAAREARRLDVEEAEPIRP